LHSGSFLRSHRFLNGCQQNRQIVNGLRFQWKLISRLFINSSLQNNPWYQCSLKSENIEILPILLAAILKIKMTLNAIFIITNQFLTSKYEICIQGHFYETTIFKMAANKIVKLSMVSDFNENWYLLLRFCWQPFWNLWPRKNDPECKFHHYQSIPHFKIT
jgi:hypothetical protein